jgi:hypothetical protein
MQVKHLVEQSKILLLEFTRTGLDQLVEILFLLAFTNGWILTIFRITSQTIGGCSLTGHTINVALLA